MKSGIGWIDFSSEHRDKVHTVLDLLSAPGVIDELGIGVIRDALADRMFPGISTIQTRPKYFTLVSLLLKRYQDVEMKRRSPRPLHRFLEDEEKDCRIRMVQANAENRANLGIIGGSFGVDRRTDVVRRPSSVYWNGLRKFGLISPPTLSLAEFGRRLQDPGLGANLHAVLKETKADRGDDNDAIDGGPSLRVKTPDISDNYWDTLSIELTKEEALFIHGQIVSNQPDSLLGQILMKEESMKSVVLMSSDAGFDQFSNLPFIAELESEELRRTVQHARDFWKLIEGAHIRYNCLLQSRYGDGEKIDEFTERWEAWQNRLESILPTWDSAFFWSIISAQGSRVKPSTRAFVDSWIDECRKGALNTESCDSLIIRQEIRNKGTRARLRPNLSESINSWIGIDVMNFRINVVRQLIQDLIDADFSKGGGHA